MTYHVVEKGLTMPNRRFVFGRSVLNNLVDRIERYVGLYGDDDKQVRHAIGVIRAYVAMNETCEKKPEDESFWNKLLHFLEKYPKMSFILEKMRHSLSLQELVILLDIMPIRNCLWIAFVVL